MAKIVIIGAGSGFGGRLSIDIMSHEELQHSTICLCDKSPERLELVANYVRRTAEKYGLPTKIEAGTDRTALLPGADYVITSISVGGGAYYGHPYMAEVEIPRKYGIEQSVADTCSVGAVFRFLRTGPVQQQILRDVERICPDAYLLNHTNPMAMLIWLHSVGTSLRNVGLCHGIQHTANQLSAFMGIPTKEWSYHVAGINHMAWFLEMKRGKEDLYPLLRAKIADPAHQDSKFMQTERVRLEIMNQFGYFPTESSRHDSEYLPYFRRTPELLAEYGLQPREVPNEQPQNRQWMKETQGDGESAPVGELRKSEEYTSGIIKAIETDVPFSFNGNVMNTGLITNLPQGSCVEVPCLVDARGIHPCYVGDLPSHLAALNRSNIAVQELAVQAVLNRDREAAFYACALDPLTSSMLSLPKIREMFEELWAAEGDLLQWFDPSFRGDLQETYAK
jgi:alpha-galactosidase